MKLQNCFFPLKKIRKTTKEKQTSREIRKPGTEKKETETIVISFQNETCDKIEKEEKENSEDGIKKLEENIQKQKMDDMEKNTWKKQNVLIN